MGMAIITQELNSGLDTTSNFALWSAFSTITYLLGFLCRITALSFMGRVSRFLWPRYPNRLVVVYFFAGFRTPNRLDGGVVESCRRRVLAASVLRLLTHEFQAGGLIGTLGQQFDI